MARKTLLGNKVRQLRRRKGLTQVALAQQLGISPSYLNLIEHNQRSVTVPLLLKLAEVFEADIASLAPDDDARLFAELSEVLGDSLFAGFDIKPPDVRDLVGSAPNACRAMLALYRNYRAALSENRALVDRLSNEGQQVGLDGGHTPPEEEVGDLLQEHLNHFPTLEEAAEHLWEEARLHRGDLDRHLVEHLRQRHDVRVDVIPSDEAGDLVRRFDADARRLLISEVLAPRSRSFQLAHQVALLECRPALDVYVEQGKLSTRDSRALARVALANYFAGAVLMPYEPFLKAARSVRYDIELLGHRFRTSFEQVCHRFTTLQRPSNKGVPFHFVRVDIAGNVSKRFSASGMAFARYSGSCPRWNVHTAFLSPGFIRTQLSRMPDGTSYFCIARTVRKEGGGYGVPQSRLAIGLGCEIGLASELVYADGVDLKNLDAAVPIGVACRLCERMDCRQRAFPPLEQDMAVDENVRGLSFYATGNPGAS
jgi:predicted transcriptional regulator/transcriptional regulator with XRE-family HTH domain